MRRLAQLSIPWASAVVLAWSAAAEERPAGTGGVVVVEARQTGIWPQPGVVYTLGPGTNLAHATDDPGPQSTHAYAAWCLVREFIARTALRDAIPSSPWAGCSRNDLNICTVGFRNKTNGAEVVLLVNNREQSIRLNKGKSAPEDGEFAWTVGCDTNGELIAQVRWLYKDAGLTATNCPIWAGTRLTLVEEREDRVLVACGPGDVLPDVRWAATVKGDVGGWLPRRSLVKVPAAVWEQMRGKAGQPLTNQWGAVGMPTMSKEEAIRVLAKDHYNKLAMEALMVHGSLEYERKRKRRDEQRAQLDTDLLGIDTSVFGKPPRGGPWPEDEFQSLLKRQEELRKQKIPPTGADAGMPPTPPAKASAMSEMRPEQQGPGICTAQERADV